MLFPKLNFHFLILLCIWSLTSACDSYNAYKAHVRALSHIEKQEWDDAIVALTDCIRHRPTSDNYLARGNIYRSKSDYASAIRDYNRAIEINPKKAGAFFYRGIVNSEQGKTSDAIDDFTKALTLEPTQSSAYINRGMCHDKLGYFDKAVQDFTSAIKIEPKDHVAYMYRAMALHKSGKKDIAINDFNKAVDLAPNNAEVYLRRGITLHNKKEPVKAIKDLDKAIEINPRYAEAFFYRGLIFHEKLSYDKAMENYMKVLSMRDMVTFENMLAVVHSNIGLILHEKGEYDAAIKNHNIAIKIAPNIAEWYLGRAIAYGLKGDQSKSIEDAKKFRSLKKEVSQRILDQIKEDLTGKVPAAFQKRFLKVVTKGN